MDSRPKRRKTKDNPYTLESIEEMKIYRVSFVIILVRNIQ